MGHEQSNLSGLKLDKKALEITEFWNQYSATINDENIVSIFIGEPLVGGSLWINKTPLEKAAKNLMLYRHPCILRYISSWHKGSKFYLALEDAKPLSLVLASQNALQVCVGLHSILKALCFLHDTAHTSHNNVCISSIYVTSDGNWKLGGMEYLCRYEDLTNEYLTKTRSYRYKEAIDPNENKNGNERPHLIDCYSYCVLVNQVFQMKSDDDQVLTNFKEFCTVELQTKDETSRPKLSTLLDHEFFSQNFIVVYSFLTELPLKDDNSKVEFFGTLTEKLRSFSEDVVANQLGGLLLSRMVFLDETAQRELLPFVLCPRAKVTEVGLFSTNNFKKYIVPRLLKIFCVRDAQIRLLLLRYFERYVVCFSNDELESQILPELLVGIKDTNNQLVSVTLRALSELVPILGAATVIGGKRAKLFNDGRPIIHCRSDSRKMLVVQSDQLTASSRTEARSPIELSERPSPDGEEGETSTEVEQSAEDDLDNWEDWEESNSGAVTDNLFVMDVIYHDEPATTQTISETFDPLLENNVKNLEIDDHLTDKEETRLLQIKHAKKVNLPDILELDIKCQVQSSVKDYDEFNYFQDMEPEIDTSNKYLVSSEAIEVDAHKPTCKLNLDVTGLDQIEDGWEEEPDWE